MADPFASGPIATTLAWVVSAGSLLGAVAWLFGFLTEEDEMARPFKAWMIVCLALFTPARYMLFQVVAAETFIVQSFRAFFTSFILALYVPIVFGVLFFVGVGLPIGIAVLIVGEEGRQSTGRYVTATLTLPILCVLSSLLFHLALPLAASSVRWLPAEHVIKATNGPAAVVFDYVASPFSPLTMPKYFELTPRDQRALRRCHVATLYLSAKQELRFLEQAYPQVYSSVTRE